MLIQAQSPKLMAQSPVKMIKKITANPGIWICSLENLNIKKYDPDRSIFR
jgi:hypothetical protein